MYKYNIDEIKQLNKDAGLHFFDDDTLQFFNSVIYDTVYNGSNGCYFVTSEQFVNGGYKAARKFTVRQFCSSNGKVHTMSKFNSFSDKDDAIEYAKELAKGE